jgi:L-ribulose-5-phosphate 3-epimerase
MKNNSFVQRLAVCSWSLQPATPQDLAAKLLATGIQRVQLALDPLIDSPSVWSATGSVFGTNGFKIISGMFGFAGEDYSTPKSIRATGGIAPDAYWSRNWERVQASAALAQELGLKLVTFHAGFLPEPCDPGFPKLRDRLAQVADAFGTRGIALGLETGQESSHGLIHLLQSVGRPNLVVNFDPANMILYDREDPLKALRTLGSWVRQVHIKDATRTSVSGAWGAEVPVGRGEVDWRAFFQTLDDLDYTGDLVIEREAGDQRIADIRTAREAVEKAVH